MLCALTHNKEQVWATFLDDSWSGYPELYLHTNPSLKHDDGNVAMNDIDYSSVTSMFGILVSQVNFFERALCVWSSIGAFELKTKDELELRMSGMQNNLVDLTDDDGSDDDFYDVVAKQETVQEPYDDAMDIEAMDATNSNSTQDSDEDVEDDSETSAIGFDDLVLDLSDFESEASQELSSLEHDMVREDDVSLQDSYARDESVDEEVDDEIMWSEEHLAHFS
jgi:hypothetical protein